jgi:hypothetical protein
LQVCRDSCFPSLSVVVVCEANNDDTLDGEWSCWYNTGE